MSSRIAVAVVIAMAAQPVFADRATSRGGSTSRGASSASAKTSGHPSPSSSHSASSSKTSQGSKNAVRVPTGAEARHPRAGTGSHNRYGRGYYYRPSRGWGYYPYSGYYPYYWNYGLGWGGGGGYYTLQRADDRELGYGWLRILVDPDDARVFLDGRYVGEVDDFDGMFDRLRASEGRHELTLKKEGYRTHRFLIHVPEYQSIKIHLHMVKGAGEDPVEDLAGEWVEKRPRRASDEDDENAEATAEEAEDQADDAEEVAPERRAPREPNAAIGSLMLSVRPEDASVYVDGQFRGPGRDASRVDLAPGRHRVEVVRPGYTTFEVDVDVAKDQPARLEVELERP